jgi:hypothetical protein
MFVGLQCFPSPMAAPGVAGVSADLGVFLCSRSGGCRVTSFRPCCPYWHFCFTPCCAVCVCSPQVSDDAEPMTRPPSDDAPFSGLAFKIMTDPFVGSLTFVRIYRCGGVGVGCVVRAVVYARLGLHALWRCAPA